VHSFYLCPKAVGNTLTLQDQLVLRLEKVPNNSPIDDTRHPTKIYLEVEFVKIVMTKLLGRSFVAPPQIVYLQKEEIENLNKLLLHVRPGEINRKQVYREEILLN